jgi:hypothetical protein
VEAAGCVFSRGSGWFLVNVKERRHGLESGTSGTRSVGSGWWLVDSWRGPVGRSPLLVRQGRAVGSGKNWGHECTSCTKMGFDYSETRGANGIVTVPPLPGPLPQIQERDLEEKEEDWEVWIHNH